MDNVIKKVIDRSRTGIGVNPLISQNTITLLNTRIEQEESSSRRYLAMSLWLNNEGYTGASSLWRKYSNEELEHANWAREHLLAYGILPATPALKAPGQSFMGLPDIIHQSYAHELDITRQCMELGSAGLKEGDLVLHELSLKFLHEQREEMDKMQTWEDKLSSFGEDPLALRLLDNEMGS